MRYWELSFILKGFVVFSCPSHVSCESASNCQALIIASVLGTFAASLLIFTFIGCLMVSKYRRSGKSEHFARAIVLSKDQLVEDGYEQRINGDSQSGDHVISNESVIPIDDAPQLHSTAHKTHSQTSMNFSTREPTNPIARLFDYDVINYRITIQLYRGSNNGSFGIQFGIAGLFIKDVTSDCHVVGNGYRLEEGDEVVSINGISLGGMNDQQAFDILVRAGKHVSLDVLQSGFKHKVNAGDVAGSSLKTSFGGGSPSNSYTKLNASPASTTTHRVTDPSLVFNEATLYDHGKTRTGLDIKANERPSGLAYRKSSSNLIASASMPSLNMTSSHDGRFISYQRQHSPIMTSSVDCLATNEAIDENSNSLRNKRKTNRRNRTQKASSAIFSTDINAARNQHTEQPFDVNLSRSRFPAPSTLMKVDANDAMSNSLNTSLDRNDFAARLAIAKSHDNNGINLAEPPSPGDDDSALAFAISVAKMRQAAASTPSSTYFNRAAYHNQLDHYTSIELDPDVMREMTAKYSEPRFPLTHTATNGESSSYINTSPNIDPHLNGIDGNASHSQQRYRGSTSVELDVADRERLIYRKSISAQNGNGLSGSPSGSQDGGYYDRHYGLGPDVQRPRSHSSNLDTNGDTSSKQHRSSTSLASSPPVRRRTMKIANPRSASFLKPRRQPKRAHSLPPSQEHGNTHRAVKADARPNGSTNQTMFATLDSVNRRKSIDSGTLKKLHGELQANPLLCSEYPIIAQLLGHVQLQGLTNSSSGPLENDNEIGSSYNC